MTTTADKLVEALRAMLDAPPPCDCGIQGCGRGDCPEARRLAANAGASAALAAYDAERAAPARETVPAGSHTAEPWRVATTADFFPLEEGETPRLCSIDGADGRSVAVSDYYVITEANARRIVACVNACAGIDTETLERMPAGTLHAARRVCVEFERDYGDDLTNDEPLSGADVVDTLCRVAEDVRAGAGGAV
jgi:hypothetical protein